MFAPHSPTPIKNAIPLTRLKGLSAEQIQQLHQRWIISVQEFAALVEMPSARPKLADILKIEASDLQQMADSAQSQLAPMRGETGPDKRLLKATYRSGALPLPATLRGSTKFEIIPHEAPMPPALSYSDDLPPLRDQGDRGTCVAHAAAAVREFMEIQQRKRTGDKVQKEKIDLSEQFIYWWCKEKDKLPDVSGTYPNLGLQCLAEAGAPTETTWPYNPTPTPGDESQGPPPKAAIEEAKRYRVSQVIHLNPHDIESMKAALLQGKSVMIAIPIFDTWFNSQATRRYGKINMPLPDEDQFGAHTVALVGYVDDDAAPGGGYFLLRNSWKPWGMENPLGRGLGAIPYAFLQQFNTLADTIDLPAAADVYIRDNEKDAGEAPSRGLAFNSPDIWLRQKKDGKTQHEQPQPGRQSFVYARVWNKGPGDVSRVLVKLFAAPASPSIWPDMWQPIGETTLDHLAAGKNAITALAWTPTDAGPYRFLARLDAAEDPARHLWAVRYDNNIAQKNLLTMTLHPGESRTLRFPLYGLPQALTLRNLHIDRGAFRKGSLTLNIEKGQKQRGAQIMREDAVLRTFAKGATEMRNAQLTITMAATATPKDGGRILISQMDGETLIGRMMVEVKVAAAS